MKKNRILSALFAVILAVTMLPWSSLPSPLFAAGDSTDITIDFDYAANNGVTSAKDALRLLGEAGFDEHKNDPLVDENYWKSSYNKFKWIPVTRWTGDLSTEGSLMKALATPGSELHDVQYISLTADDYSERSGSTPWETITITTDKVLDLNGHTLAIQYNRNRTQGGTHSQNQDVETHKCIAIEIENGATLTIIDSSAWRGAEPDGKGTGKLSFTGYMVDPYSYDINYYTTRDLFWVNNGNLVIYGGTFQAGRKKDQLKSGFTWNKLKTAIGSVVELGVNVAEYATGLNTASAAYRDLLSQQTSKTALKEIGDTGNKDDGKDSPTQTVIPRNGTNQDPHEEVRMDGPDKGKDRDQTVGEKNGGNGENKSNEKGNAKDDTETQLAKAENNIVNQALDSDKISNIVNSAFGLAENIVSMFGTDEKTRVTQSIKGTVVHVGNQGSFVSYGGTFQGYGSTPNTRNGVIEVNVIPKVGNDKGKDFDHSKNQGGLAYVYGGTFEAYNGANVFNMVRYNEIQYAMQYVKSDSASVSDTDPVRVPLGTNETNGVEVLYYENQDALSSGSNETPVPINTANIQVRGGLFRCFYDVMNVAVKGDNNDQHFTKFPGTMGSVNLGVESFNNDLIQDGRIQIIDKYGDGALVLLDEQTEEEAGNDGLYHYRLFCGDTELRYKSYLEVYPNETRTNASRSMQLATYVGTGKQTSLIFANDEEGDNIRAPYRQTENYFDYMIDAETAGNWSVKPNFHYGETKSEQARMDIYGERIATSEVWYYPKPLNADGAPIEDVSYGWAWMTYVPKGQSSGTAVRQSEVTDEKWTQIVTKEAAEGSVRYYAVDHDSIRSNLQYFTYKIYRVDPLTRENISESGTYGVDEPLITVRYGKSDDSLRCKLPLKTLEREIKQRRPELNWRGYQAGEMYRIVLTVEEYVGIHYQGYGFFGDELPAAKTETSILFRCFTYDEQEETETIYKAHDFTPVQWAKASKSHEEQIQIPIKAGSTATINFVNAKTGMTDYVGDVKVFDIYYQWWEVDENGNELRMIAGTDNIYDETMGDREDHRPESWNVGHDGKTYVNTVDPNDPNASTYGDNGLPLSTRDWKNYMIHFYGAGSVTKEELTKDGTDALSLENNRVFAFNSDSCYIPEDMAGKYLRVKVIAQNVEWPMAFDKKQTFLSHIVKVGGAPQQPITGKTEITYDSGMEYATYESPVKIALSDVGGLSADETITTVYYRAGGDMAMDFTGLNAKDASEIPAAEFPKDFYSSQKNLEKVNGGDRKAYAVIITNKGRNYVTDQIGFRYEVEAKSIARIGEATQQIRLEDIRNGKYQNGMTAFVVKPSNATMGWSFKDFTNTDSDVLTLDEKGVIHFTGRIGTAAVSGTGPDGQTVSLTVQVTDSFDRVEISGIREPVVGELLSTSLLTAKVPEDAGYTIVKKFWTRDNKLESLDARAKAENYHSYTANIVIAPKENYERKAGYSSFTISADMTDGSVQTVSGQYGLDNHMNNYSTYYNDGEPGWYLLRYKFDAVSGTGLTLNKIYVDFPDEVMEGDNVDEWMKKVHVYTNGDDEQFEFSAYASYDAYAFETAETYSEGRLALNEINTFIPGIQSGVMARISIPADLSVSFPASGSITVYVNGQPTGKVYDREEKVLVVSAFDSLKILPCRNPEPMPIYELAPLNMVSGTTVNVQDLLICDDERVHIFLSGVQNSTYDVTSYLTIDMENGTITPRMALYPSYYPDVYVRVEFDENGDGKPEFFEEKAYSSCPVYSSASQIPADTDAPFQVTVLDPDGNAAGSYEVPYGETISVPEVQNAFYAAVTDPNVEDGAKNLLDPLKKHTYGYDRLHIYQQYTEPGDTLYVHTVRAEDAEVTVGADELYLFLKDADGRDVPGIFVSVDGEHFAADDRITGLNPNTEYMVSYKQGINGTVYTKTVRTAGVEYGVSVGRRIVTDIDQGNLERDGWHYDLETGVLTLKKLNLFDQGADAQAAMLYMVPMRLGAAIYSEGDLIIELVGNNSVKMDTQHRSSGAVTGSALIDAAGDITVRGNGNLTMSRDIKDNSQGFFSENGSIYLEGSGKLVFESLDCAFYTPEGGTIYKNGTIDFTSQIMYLDGEPYYQASRLMRSEEVDYLSFADKVHDLTISVGNLAGQYRTVTEEELREAIRNTDVMSAEYNVSIVPTHSDNQKVVQAQYLKMGSCDKGATYFYSCSCGHISETRTFTQSAGAHDLIHHEAKSADCISEGWSAYDTCSKCGYSTFEAIPALGHQWLVHRELEPTCTEDGHPAYDTCGRCGASSLPESDEGAKRSTRSSSDVDAARWKALGHDYKHVTGSAPTCTTDGTIDYWECVHCGALSMDEYGAIPLSASELTAPAMGHLWTPWEIITEATPNRPGTAEHFCERCGETETMSVPYTGDEPWTWTRLAGKNRYQTATLATQEVYEDGSCEQIIIASGQAFPDALSGSALAGALGCPILLTNKTKLSPDTKTELQRIAAEGCTVYILGGNGAVSANVEQEIVDLGIGEVKRIKGSNREATAKAVYEKGVEAGGFAEGCTIIVATGYAYADVLSISPYAYAAKAPVILAKKDGSLSDETKGLISETIKPGKAIVIGGSKAVSTDTEDYLKSIAGEGNVIRLSGKNRYITSAEIMKWELGLATDAPFQPEVEMHADGMGVATGTNFADALGATSLLGKIASPLLLVADNNQTNKEATQANINELVVPSAKEMTKGYIFGGKGAVSLQIEEWLNEAVE